MSLALICSEMFDRISIRRSTTLTVKGGTTHKPWKLRVKAFLLKWFIEKKKIWDPEYAFSSIWLVWAHTQPFVDLFSLHLTTNNIHGWQLDLVFAYRTIACKNTRAHFKLCNFIVWLFGARKWKTNEWKSCNLWTDKQSRRLTSPTV